MRNTLAKEYNGFKTGNNKVKEEIMDITKIDDRTAEIRETTTTTKNVTLDQLYVQRATAQNQINTLQTTIDSIDFQISQLKELGVKDISEITAASMAVELKKEV
jgi:hypothetical protein